MFPFWEVAVAPVLAAAGVQRLVEIGALRGENTRQIIERLGPRTELHVIDPLPDFDPAVHELEFAGQYVFHRDLSLNVLGDLPPMDAALIDGDHNWYTVYNELRLLREVAREHDAPLPVLLLHDVGWPYGRRDLYYDPSNIPEEFRRDWKRSGMEPGKVRLVPFGAGLNPTLANAKVEGGRRNGVMTAVDDFVKEHDRPLRVVVLPIYFGLAIVVEVERLERQPALAAELDRLESPAGKDQLLALAEDIRLQALIFQHKIYFDRERSVTRLARRYLGQVKEGLSGGGERRATLDQLEECLDTVVQGYGRGDVVACGIDDPSPAVFAGAYLDAYDLGGRDLWLVDGGQADARTAEVFGGLERLDVMAGRTHVVGVADAGLPAQVALLHVGAGVGAEATGVLGQLYERLAGGGVVLVDEQVDVGVAAALEDLRARDGVTEADGGVGADGRWWRKGGAAATTPVTPDDQAAGL